MSENEWAGRVFEIGKLVMSYTWPIAAVTIGSAGAYASVSAATRVGCLMFRPFFHPPKFLSVRTKEIDAFKQSLSTCGDDQYLVVLGPKGVGKTSLIHTALGRKPGVVHLEVRKAMDDDKLRTMVYEALTKIGNRFAQNNQADAQRVVKWYNRMPFLDKPTVVLHVGDEAYSALEIAKSLLTELPVRIVIDGSNNSVPRMALETKRQALMEVGEMDKQTVEAIPELADLISLLRKAKLDGVVFSVLGGVPADYFGLRRTLRAARVDPSALDSLPPAGLKVIDGFLQVLINDAIKHKRALVRHGETVEDILRRFEGKDGVSAVPISSLPKHITFPSPNKLLREVLMEDASSHKTYFLVPASAATALVLRHGDWLDSPTLAELQTLLASPSSSPA